MKTRIEITIERWTKKEKFMIIAAVVMFVNWMIVIIALPKLLVLNLIPAIGFTVAFIATSVLLIKEKRWQKRNRLGNLIYEEGSETIRQMPQNFLIAHRENGRWICEPDLAANKGFAIKVFTALLDYDTKYGDGLHLLEKVK